MRAAEAGLAEDRLPAARDRLPRRLPPIKEGWLRGYQALWIAIFLLAVLMSAGGVYVRLVSSEGLTTPFERAGLLVGEREGRLRVRLTVGEAAAGLGIKSGDAIVAVNGRAVSDDPAAYDELGERLDGPAGTRLTLAIRHPDGVTRTHSLARGQRHIDQAFAEAGLTRGLMRAADLADVLTTLLLLAAAMLLFRRRPRDPVAALLSLGLLLNLSGSGSSEYLIMETGGDAFFLALLIVGWMCLLLAILTFPDGRFEPRWTLLVALLLPVGGAIEYIDESAGTLSDIAFMMAGVLAITMRYRRSPAGDQRQQIRWALLGFAAGAFFILLDQALLLLYRNAPSITVALWSELLHYLVYALAFACIPLGLLISLLRYRLYDADAAISRSAVYATLTLLMSAVFAGSMSGLEKVIEASFGRDAGAEAAAVAAAFTVVMVAPAHNMVHRWAEARFQRRLLELRQDLPESLAEMRESAGTDELLDRLMTRIMAGVRASRAAVLLRDGGVSRVAAVRAVSEAEVEKWSGDFAASQDPIDCRRDDRLFPVRIRLDPGQGKETAPIGWILLGPRPDGSFYGKDEQEALAQIAEPIARAVQIVRLREAREAAGREQIEALNSRLAALEAALAKTIEGLAAKPRRAGG